MGPTWGDTTGSWGGLSRRPPGGRRAGAGLETSGKPAPHSGLRKQQEKVCSYLHPVILVTQNTVKEAAYPRGCDPCCVQHWSRCGRAADGRVGFFQPQGLLVSPPHTHSQSACSKITRVALKALPGVIPKPPWGQQSPRCIRSRR